ncbi:GntR family transcriptional regulator [Undibacterium sp. Di24W]|uniref:GntR family transcriptional regulator n=1 Tax=Undibacterium sp. Di24W TaxID=3413033 RepID=UPI003BEF7806
MQPAKVTPQNKMRAADVAYDAIESMIVTLQLKPGAPIVESELIEITGLGRTPLREALMRMSSNGLILQLPRRGLIVKDIEAAEHVSLIETRRVIEKLIASSAARRASPQLRQDILACGEKMVSAAENGKLDEFMFADQALDHVVHEACRNPSAVAAVIPLIIKCRRFWYAYQHEGDLHEAARCHMLLAQGIADGNEAAAASGAENLMDYLESYTRKVING